MPKPLIESSSSIKDTVMEVQDQFVSITAVNNVAERPHLPPRTTPHPPIATLFKNNTHHPNNNNPSNNKLF